MTWTKDTEVTTAGTGLPGSRERAEVRRSVRAGWLACGIVVVASAMAAGAVTVWSAIAKQTRTESHTYRLPVTRLELDVASTDLVVQPGRQGEVVVERRLAWSLRKPVISEEPVGSTLRLASRCPDDLLAAGCELSYVITVPPNVAVDARTSSGNISFRDTGGDWQFSTLSGQVTGTGLRSARLAVKGGTGDVDLYFVTTPQSVQVETSAGNIDVLLPDDVYRVEAGSNSGQSVTGIHHTDAATRTVSARSDAGDVRLQPRDS